MQPSRLRRAFRPLLEVLEDRTVPSFLPAVSYPVGANPAALAVGDFNNNGCDGLVVANAGDNDVSVLLGSPSGTLQPAGTYAVGAGPHAVAVGDFNGDGKLDIVTGNQNDVSVLLGNGDGTFQPARTFSLPQVLDQGGNRPQSPQAVAVGDLNGDGKLDLVVVAYDTYPGPYNLSYGQEYVDVLLGDGTGSFAAKSASLLYPQLSADSAAVAVGDFTGDGKPDVVASLEFSGSADGLNTFTTFKVGNGDGTFQPNGSNGDPTNLAQTPGLLASVAAADFNGDGKLDFVIPGARYGNLPGPGIVSAFLGNGNGTFQVPVTPDGGYAEAETAAVGDFNHDGKMGVVTANQDGTVSVLAGNGDGTFQPFQQYQTGTSANAVAVGDFSGSGYADVAVLDPSTGNVWVLPNDGTTAGAQLSLAAPAAVTAGTPTSITVTALNADGSTATNYQGTVHFSSSDGQAVLPADYTFTAADQGTHTFPVSLQTAGSQSIAATDTSDLISPNTASLTVSPAAVSGLRLSAPPVVTAGTPFSVTVAATDPYGNVVTDYAGTVHLGSGDPLALMPADYTFTAADQGAHTFTVTLGSAVAPAITATDADGLGGTSALTVGPAKVVVSAPAAVTAGNAFNLTVTAFNADGSAATGYAGTVHFSSSDGQAVLPTDYTFTAADQGKHTFSATLVTAGRQPLTAADSASGVSGSAAGITVSAAAPSQVVFTQGPTSGTAGTALSAVQASVEDRFGNVINGYGGPVSVSVAGGPGGFAAGSTTTAGARGGVATFSNLLLDTAGTYTLSAAVAGLAAATSNPLHISPAAASRLVFTQLPSGGSAGQALGPVKVAVEDRFGNLVISPPRTVVTMSVQSGPGGFVSGSGTAAPALNGVATFSRLILSAAGTYTLKARFSTLFGVSSSFTVGTTNVSASVRVALVSSVSSSSGVYTLNVALTNAGGAILSGPLALVVTGLPGGVTLLNGSGTTGGNPYVDFLPAGQALAPGQKATLGLKFSARSLKSITYITQILEGI